MGQYVIDSKIDPAVVLFSRKSDAMMCKLVWAQTSHAWQEGDPSMGSSGYVNPPPAGGRYPSN
jgi:hypothetical protein